VPVDLDRVKGHKGPAGRVQWALVGLTFAVCAFSARHHWSVWLPFCIAAVTTLFAIHGMLTAVLRFKGLIPRASWADLCLIVALTSLIPGIIFGGVGVALADVVKWAADRTPNDRALVAIAVLFLAAFYYRYLEAKMRSTAGGLQVLAGAATGWYTAHYGIDAAPTLPLLAISCVGAVFLIAQGLRDLADVISGRDDLISAIMINAFGEGPKARPMPPRAVS
jgi:hypothetical protein